MNKTFKKTLNPFWVSKLDLNTINHFPFPEVKHSYFKSSVGNQK
eukprot:CAMPEP_0170508846 /NCGR_PEP_ID=MMETSP0208-20121228/63636_1 /TAXON_ID=197538 /ORGANISM="Strombidium inclinatum, Strain S3" /LENGTH=43 /DNA_ID= /DNA_START= /DNA_END= /DNA_ORIENTATION=